MEIYLDNSATTRVYPEVAELMKQIMLEDYGNPSSVHNKGLDAEKHLRLAKTRLAAALKAKEKEILFTSGGTESDNLAIIGGARANQRAGKHIITTKVEHPAVLKTFEYLEKEGFETDYLGVDELGRISLEELKSKLRPDTILVSVMHTNNEVGAVEPVAEAGVIIKAYNPKILFHVDAVQGFGKAEIIPSKAHIDLMSISSHKIHGPKGVGALYVKDGVRLIPISYGGGQQEGLRSGTLNVPGIAGMGLAAEMITKDLPSKRERLFDIKNSFLKQVSKIPGLKVNGCERTESGDFKVKETAPHIINISVPGMRSEVMLHALEEQGIYVSAGSACSSHSKKESSTLKAMGATAAETDGALRFSMSEATTSEDMNTAAETLKAVVDKFGKYIRS
ncbi:MAG: cysteine desulfurase [Lachnospiraceae bacterium]|nr:cysteine desulfurase [Lachnospiraceae bacterium]